MRDQPNLVNLLQSIVSWCCWYAKRNGVSLCLL